MTADGSTASFDLDRIGGIAALHALVDEVLACGEQALRLWRNGVADRMEMKADNSPVTEADREVEARLRRFLRSRFPDAGFVGEESGGDPGANGMRFMVDPIDGTRAFIRGIPTWAILVGLEADGVPVLGVALMPAAGDLFVGVRGGGALVNGRLAHLSEVDSLDRAVVSHGGLHQFTDAGLSHLLSRMGEHTYTQRGFGDFDGVRQLLAGRVDAMVDPGVAPWDICPAAVLVREAGGRLTSLSGEETIHGGSALATNGLIHEALLELFA